ncbi:hypothetical protein HYH11_05555 [Lactobacillus salivarius]|uniref:hypothetical protein n=1 Tax=Ligilactobacillus salivarius TaxID=1624 RepID=UPI0015C63430|nr:hypothetical protein [Ligilactobacillus salivarius]NXZ96040.1 hypothetical protein [Ligilactobacillus salivarius]NYA58436.1 hypothetical protein [Ligilactobacillus salivarius]NYA61253.1 hypothetical protein [Ligilactobacillus salivarius]NYA62105.1 hypothetical protein [Ligilactobacillus salivarius]NYA68394.1 hypothetical protein [Ligilactobacillus salivarius]
MQAMEKHTKLLNDLNNFIEIKRILADNVKTLDKISDDIDEQEREIERLEQLNTPTFQIKKMQDNHDIKATSYNLLLELHQHNLITLWKLSRYILKQFKYFSEDEIKEYNLADIQASIKEQSDNIKPKFIDLVKYDITHIKD